jgi:hypothetical protein
VTTGPRPDQARTEQVRRARLASLLLDERQARTPVEVARWFGAMQAQDAASGLWSLGVRCAGTVEADVQAAFERRELVRTWPMRGTIHIVPAEDVRWMLEHVGSRALADAAKRRAGLGLSDADAERAVSALDSGLADGGLRTRGEALDLIAAAGIDTSGQRGYHLLWYAAQLGVTCLGPQQGSEQTVVRLADWAPTQLTMSRADAHAELLFRYVRSHGPAPLQDFAGWSALTMTDVRAAAAANEGRLEPDQPGPRALWHVVGQPLEGLPEGRTIALPGYDEFILGYKDRDLQVPPGMLDRIVPGGNGVFRATIVRDGLAIATWPRTTQRGRVVVTVEAFTDIPTRQRPAVERALQEYAEFRGVLLDITFA